MLNMPNKSVETMMLTFKGDDPNSIRSMQHFLSEGRWQDKAILQRHWQEVSHDLGDKNGVLIGDGSGFLKQGEASVAVKRQWCGQLGKIANCQVGVFLGYASQHGRTLLNRRLYLPQEWVAEAAYAERRRKCGVPEETTFKTKPALLLEMVKEVHADGSLPFQWLTCDEAFGRDTAFLDRVGDYLWYFSEVDLDTRVWLARPQTAIPEWSGQGRKPTRERLVAGGAEAQEVNVMASPSTPSSPKIGKWTPLSSSRPRENLSNPRPIKINQHHSSNNAHFNVSFTSASTSPGGLVSAARASQ